MYILGITSYFHESSAALIKDGELRVLIEQERMTRQRHTSQFPKEAIEACLRHEGIGFNDIEKITFFWKPRREMPDSIRSAFRFFLQSLKTLSAYSQGEVKASHRLKSMKSIGDELKKEFNLQQIPKVEFVEHPLCHASSAFFVSPFEEAAILTLDGRGEATSSMLASGRGTTIEKIREIKFPHSLGHLYAAVTAYLGFKPFSEEWKVMGMSGYGKDNLMESFARLVRLTNDGGYRLNLRYFKFHRSRHSQWVTSAFRRRFGPPRGKNDPFEQRHFDLAFALQKTVELVGVHLANELYRKTRSPNLCLTGGVALNYFLNRRIIENTHFKNFFIQPLADDAGASFGSALYHYHDVTSAPRQFIFDHVYLGPEFTDDQIERALIRKGIAYQRCGNIFEETARQIARRRMVAWFQGRMEAGPRALGNRSIVVDPTDPGMRDRLIERVKKQEFFRPFAPSVLEEKVFDYFHMPKGQMSPYMAVAGNVRKEKQSILPAVTHADGTARVHTVNKKVNPRYWQLISEFDKLTGVPVILNTSFREDEPIVCTPEDAVNCFLRMELDALAIGDFLAIK